MCVCVCVCVSVSVSVVVYTKKQRCLSIITNRCRCDNLGRCADSKLQKATNLKSAMLDYPITKNDYSAAVPLLMTPLGRSVPFGYPKLHVMDILPSIPKDNRNYLLNCSKNFNSPSPPPQFRRDHTMYQRDNGWEELLLGHCKDIGGYGGTEYRTR